MIEHPENNQNTNNLVSWFNSQELVDVWCKGCGCFRRMNAVYAKHLGGEIEGCGACRVD